MQKVSELFSRLVSKPRSQLETDAIPVPDNNPSQNINSQPAYSPINTLDLQDNNQLATIPTLPMGQAVAPLSTELMNRSGTSPGANNNILALNNTQGYNVYQFTHVKGLQIGHVYNINSEREERNSESNQKQKRLKTHTIKEMMESDQELPKTMLNIIATHLGEGWRDVMRKLNYSDGQIHQAIVDYKIDGGLKEVIYQLLLDWTQNDDNPTLGRITELLWNLGHTETVYYMKKSLKSERKASQC